jgi:hypothetical protein
MLFKEIIAGYPENHTEHSVTDFEVASTYNYH